MITKRFRASQLIFKSILLICFYINLTISQSGTNNYTLFKVSQQRGAACLDGSPPGLYIHQGTGSNKDNFIIMFGGGGFCGGTNLSLTLEDCYKRSNGGLGSTKNSAPYLNADQNGLLSTLKQNNPLFYDWTKIFAIYCDGTEYLSSRSQPIPYKDKNLHFRGVNNSIQYFRFLGEKFDMFNKNKIVITGISAGGIATYLWSNHAHQQTIGKSAKVLAIPDSGLFLTNYSSPIFNKNILRERANSMIQISMQQTNYPIGPCLKRLNNDYLDCLNAVNLIQDIKVPLLMIESPYDSWPIQNLIGTNCLTKITKDSPYSLQKCNQTTRQYIDNYAQMAKSSIKQMIKVKPRTGTWSPSCVKHGYTASQDIIDPKYKVPTNIGMTINDAIKQFLQNPQNPPIQIDQVKWPLNKGCSGLASLKNRINLQRMLNNFSQIQY